MSGMFFETNCRVTQAVVGNNWLCCATKSKNINDQYSVPWNTRYQTAI